jgi:pilus assembly protein CpaB
MKRSLLFAGLFAVIAALFAALYLNSLEITYRKGAEKVKVLSAKQYIDQGTVINQDLLEEKFVPKEYIQPKAIQSIKELNDSEGRSQYVAVAPIEKGEQIITTKLLLLGVETGISSIIPTEKRSFPLSCPSSEVALIKPGNRVDLIGVFDFAGKDGQRQEEAITFLQDVLVLSVGSHIFGVSDAVKKSLRKDAVPVIESEKVPVALSISPQEAEILALASEKGTIKLSLRPIGDDKLFETKGVRMQSIAGDFSQSVRKENKENAASEQYMKEIQKKQKEALDILKKYQRR